MVSFSQAVFAGVCVSSLLVLSMSATVTRPADSTTRAAPGGKAHVMNPPSVGQETGATTKLSAKGTAELRRTYCRSFVNGFGKSPRTHEIMDIMTKYRKAVTYLDVGANLGRTSLPAVYCLEPKHRVVAVEPVSKNVEVIMRDWERMQHVESVGEERMRVRKMALSDTDGYTKMFVPGKRGDNAALNQDASQLVFKDGLYTENVKTMTGDAFFKAEGIAPSVMKLDVQGSEVRVLRGMEQYLRRAKGLVIVAEQDPRLMRKSGFETTAVFDLMTGLGFKAYCKPTVAMRGDEPVMLGAERTRDEVQRVPCGDLTYWKPRGGK